MSEYGAIRVDYDAPAGARPIAIVTIDRPPVNALDSAAKDALIAVAADLSLQRDLGAVVIYGPRHFAAGDDIKEMAGSERVFAVQGREAYFGCRGSCGEHSGSRCRGSGRVRAGRGL
ncbi:enoyl-CoA hydratase-related protein [Rhodococcus sp. 27YEA15]|uniref:enoyl-CoA hydratase-related protein n=1 Tax=Rhodococcus sp. 27YEA15 TaxID=3156259 RepID=UPI003C7B9920